VGAQRWGGGCDGDRRRDDAGADALISAALYATAEGATSMRRRAAEPKPLWCWFPYAHANTLPKALGLDPYAPEFREQHQRAVLGDDATPDELTAETVRAYRDALATPRRASARGCARRPPWPSTSPRCAGWLTRSASRSSSGAPCAPNASAAENRGR
jgi:hypothetical protein